LSAPKIGAAQIGVPEISPWKIEPTKIGVTEIQPPKVGVSEISPVGGNQIVSGLRCHFFSFCFVGSVWGIIDPEE